MQHVTCLLSTSMQTTSSGCWLELFRHQPVTISNGCFGMLPGTLPTHKLVIILMLQMVKEGYSNIMMPSSAVGKWVLLLFTKFERLDGQLLGTVPTHERVIILMRAETWPALMIMPIELGVLQSVDDLEYGSRLYSLRVLLIYACMKFCCLFFFL